MHLKNYRSIQNSEFLFSSINFLIGDNNTGKTSILKFIESLYKNETLNFNKTYLADYSINELKLNKTKPIQVLYAGWQQTNKENTKKELIFEYLEINKINNSKDDVEPIITKIVTLNPKLEICVFNLKYNKFKNSRRKFLSEIESYTTKNIFEDITEFKENLNLCDKLNKHINNKVNIIEKFETLTFTEEYITSLSEKMFQIQKEYATLAKDVDHSSNDKEKEMKTEKNLENFWLKNDKILLEYNFFSRSASFLDISLLYSYFLRYISKDKNEINNHQFYRMRGNTRFFEYPYETKYVNPIRKLFKKFYSGNEKISDESSFEIFEKNTALSKEINNFFKESKMLDEITIEDNEIIGTRIIVPKYKKNKKEMNLYISGTGVSQVLPILINIFQRKTDKIFIEQPEIHLHPRAQSSLGTLFFKFFSNALEKNLNESRFLKQGFIETHSMFLINNFRYNIFANSKKIKQYESPVIWFFENLNDKTKIYNILINESGKYVGKSNKINDFFIEESIKILKIK
ncbi:AAA family ATPase [Spiroplasma platyhelix]|uniref:AAA family ATPase n=1 Tax=Spiroplasma platyhelix PALS-1 TaxID=1276218 RepID=A0A846U1H8_9MOLU|nr:AAA family ATPase [Spiroplasma platyhelix]NKE38369.1 AAA family ATPase [Spiroplasma platyhelix PALS-1]